MCTHRWKPLWKLNKSNFINFFAFKLTLNESVLELIIIIQPVN